VQRCILRDLDFPRRKLSRGDQSAYFCRPKSEETEERMQKSRSNRANKVEKSAHLHDRCEKLSLLLFFGVVASQCTPFTNGRWSVVEAKEDRLGRMHISVTLLRASSGKKKSRVQHPLVMAHCYTSSLTLCNVRHVCLFLDAVVFYFQIPNCNREMLARYLLL
jgi:hypothetical protein